MSDAAQIRVETTEDSSVVRTVSVEVPEAQVRRAFERTYENLRRGARVKGFRPGKVPRKVLEKYYGPQAAEEIERILVGETLAEALEMAKVEPVTEPDIDAPTPSLGAVFCYSARVEVKPAIALPALAKVKGARPVVEVGDAQVDERIAAMRESFAPLVEVDEGVAAETGDTLNVDFEGRVDGELFDGGKGEDLPIELGSGRLVPGFEDQLVGARAGEERTVRIEFPADYGEPSLAGKPAEFAVKVRTVRRKQLPALDDEFAKDVGEESLDALRAKVRAQILEQETAESERALHRSLVESLVALCEFEVPPGLVHQQIHAQMDSMRRQFEGQVPADVLQAELSRMHDTGRDLAERRVRDALLLDAVVREHAIEVAEEEIDARLDELAEAQGVDSQRMRQAAAQQGWRRQIAAEMLDRKALAFLAAEASVEETTGT